MAKPSIAWIIEPEAGDKPPYLTLKREVAEKREKAGDHVTPYQSQRPDTEEEEM